MKPRTSPSAQMAKRAAPDFTVGPVRTLFNAAMNAYENARGLNIGGAESGRRAKALALKKAKKGAVNG